MTPEQIALLARVRALIADETVVREVPMFGARAVMVNEKMVVSVLKGGGLLVRVDAAQHHELLGRPGAAQAETGPGRDMGPGWIEVGADAGVDDAPLESWSGTRGLQPRRDRRAPLSAGKGFHALATNPLRGAARTPEGLRIADPTAYCERFETVGRDQ